MKVINNVGLYQAVYQIISTIESTVRRIKEKGIAIGNELIFRNDIMNNFEHNNFNAQAFLVKDHP